MGKFFNILFLFLFSTLLFSCGDSGDDGNNGDPQWTTMDSDTFRALTAIWGSSPYDVYAVGLSGVLTHYDGQTWSSQTITDGVSIPTFREIWGLNENSIFATGSGKPYHYDGSTWAPIDNLYNAVWPWSIVSIWASSETDIYVATTDTRMLHTTDGINWDVVFDESVTVPGESYGQIRGSGPSDVYFISGKKVRHFDGLSWTQVDFGGSQPGGSNIIVNAADDVYLQSGQEIHHFDGISWRLLPAIPTRDINVNIIGLWADSPNNVFVSGLADQSHYAVYHFNGISWTEYVNRSITASTSRLAALWGISSNEIFLVGMNGTALRFSLQ